jgi:hypothetical protein
MPCGAVSENEWCFGKRSETADTTLITPWGSWQTWTSGQVWSSMSGEIVCYGKCRLMMPLLVFGNFPRCASTMCDMYWHWSSPPWWGTCTSAVTQQISSGVSGMMPVYLHMETATPSADKISNFVSVLAVRIFNAAKKEWHRCGSMTTETRNIGRNLESVTSDTP